MTRQEIEACFLLAGIELYAAVPSVNPYPGSQTIRGPVWTCDTSFGRLVVGWRKRVVEIDWSDIGRFPDIIPDSPQNGYRRYLHYDDVDQGPTYIHAYSLPNVARYLATFREAARTARFESKSAVHA